MSERTRGRPLLGRRGHGHQPVHPTRSLAVNAGKVEVVGSPNDPNGNSSRAPQLTRIYLRVYDSIT